MRSADAIEKASRKQPDLLEGYKRALLRLFHSDEQKEIRWHLLQMLPRMRLTQKEQRDAFHLCRSLLNDPSRIVAAEALTALCKLAELQAQLLDEAVLLLKANSRSDSAAVRARARKLIASYKV
jgi:hypothetical protein